MSSTGRARWGARRRPCCGRFGPGVTTSGPVSEVWDVKLDDFLDLPEGRVGLFDLEFAHLYGRRHYDVAVLSAKLAVRYAAPAAAAELLRAYVDAVRCDRGELARAASPVLAETLLSQLFDAVEGGDGERVGRAGRLFGQCLDGGLEGLLDEVAARPDADAGNGRNQRASSTATWARRAHARRRWAARPAPGPRPGRSRGHPDVGGAHALEPSECLLDCCRPFGSSAALATAHAERGRALGPSRPPVSGGADVAG